MLKVNFKVNFRVKVEKKHILLYIGQLCMNVDMSVNMDRMK